MTEMGLGVLLLEDRYRSVADGVFPKIVAMLNSSGKSQLLSYG